MKPKIAHVRPRKSGLFEVLSKVKAKNIKKRKKYPHRGLLGFRVYFQELFSKLFMYESIKNLCYRHLSHLKLHCSEKKS